MATDLYGVRVLDVDPEELSVRMRVFVVYYETAAREHLPLPDDPAFFLQLLWDFAEREGGPLARVLTFEDLFDVHDDVTDYAAHDCRLSRDTRWFVSGLTRVAERNHPLKRRDSRWEGLSDFYYFRDGGWKDEDRLVQADYVVRVTDARWLAGLTPGASWPTAWFPLPHIGLIREDDAPHAPNFDDPAVTVTPFGDAQPGDLAGQVRDLVFSDDGAYLAVVSARHEVAVYDTADWSPRARVAPDPADGFIFPRSTWVPGEHIVTLYEKNPPVQWAYDVDARAVVGAERQTGEARSRTGRYRASSGFGGDVARMLTAPGEPPGEPLRLGDFTPGDPGYHVQRIAFTRDESRVLLAGKEEVRVADPVTGRALSSAPTGIGGVTGFAASPSGEHFLVLESRGLSRFEEPEAAVHRTADGGLVVRASTGQVTDAVAWSPDGRLIAVALHGLDSGAFLPGEVRIFRAGLPERPPAGLLDAAESIG